MGRRRRIEIRRAPRGKVMFNGPQGDGVAGGKELVNRECRGRAARLNQGTVHDVLADFLQGGSWRWEGVRDSGGKRRSWPLPWRDSSEGCGVRISLGGGCRRHRMKGRRVLRRWQRGRGHSSEVGLDRGVGSDAAGWKTRGGLGGRQARRRRGCWSEGRLATSVIDRRDDAQFEGAGHAAQAALSAEVGVGGLLRRWSRRRSGLTRRRDVRCRSGRRERWGATSR